MSILICFFSTEKKAVPVRIEVSFDFHKLTVLLLRGAYKDKDLIGRKVCTAVLSDARIEATIGN